MVVALTTRGSAPNAPIAPVTTPTTASTTSLAVTTSTVAPEPTTTESGSTDPTTAASASPGAGQPAYLADLNRVEGSNHGNISSDDATVNGVFFGRSVVFDNYCGNGDGGVMWAEYNVSRAYRSFTTTVGISDQDPSTAKGTYRVLVDGTEVTRGSIALGSSTPLRLTITGALHIRLEITNPSTAQSSCRDGVHDVWGDAQIA